MMNILIIAYTIQLYTPGFPVARLLALALQVYQSTHAQILQQSLLKMRKQKVKQV